jgi:hypothetical protein
MEGKERSAGRVVGGVDTHKDLHVAAVVDELDRVLASQCFATTRHGYKQMLAWMGAFGSLQRVGIEATGTYGAGLLRYMQKAGIEVARSRHRTSMIVVSAGKTMILTRGTHDPCSVCRQAHRHAKKPQRHDQISARAQGCRKTAVAARRVARS